MLRPLAYLFLALALVTAPQLPSGPAPEPAATVILATGGPDPLVYEGPLDGLSQARLQYRVNSGAQREVRFALPAAGPLRAPRPAELDRLPAAVVTWRWQGQAAGGAWSDLAAGRSLVAGWAGHLEWSVELGRHVWLFYSGGERPPLPFIGEVDDEYAYLVAEFLLDPSHAPALVPMYVLARPEWEQMPKGDHRWVGLANRDGGFILQTGDAGANFDVISHELAHLLVAPTGDWVGEGLARYIEARFEPDMVRAAMPRLAERVRRLGAPHLDGTAGDDKYTLGYLWWSYLNARYGPEAVRQVVDAYVLTLSIDRAVYSALGRPRPEIEAELGQAALAYVQGDPGPWGNSNQEDAQP